MLKSIAATKNAKRLRDLPRSGKENFPTFSFRFSLFGGDHEGCPRAIMLGDDEIFPVCDLVGLRIRSPVSGAWSSTALSSSLRSLHSPQWCRPATCPQSTPIQSGRLGFTKWRRLEPTPVSSHFGFPAEFLPQFIPAIRRVFFFAVDPVPAAVLALPFGQMAQDGDLAVHEVGEWYHVDHGDRVAFGSGGSRRPSMWRPARGPF